MMIGLAAFVRALDPRLKLALALVIGPCMWLLSPLSVAACLVILLPIQLSLSICQPLGPKMVRSLGVFVLVWVVVKCVVDALSGIAAITVVENSAVLALRLGGLLLVGLSLAMSTSPRALGLAVSWGLRPVVGKERAWRVALSLALMVHFLPLCLSTMNQVRETLARRYPKCSFRERMVIIPQAVLRNLGQKTWNQTLAVAGRGLEQPEAWEPHFAWGIRDSLCALSAVCLAGAYFII
ncbi:cobalt transporter [Pseudodesulfovibrio sp. zrk46]|uniref:cobalt transporter n=1 Tax=Pseudodesulfovibrio sp. zrk46 TaxID=2725288 RepID=UPI00144A04ED|nr:cobalt transporter [Pseudodesulfovibrio sp. zrk46]QJB58228.1 cobalt transporter [Pseudodesulfovibrio sp. zrk46]